MSSWAMLQNRCPIHTQVGHLRTRKRCLLCLMEQKSCICVFKQTRLPGFHLNENVMTISAKNHPNNLADQVLDTFLDEIWYILDRGQQCFEAGEEDRKNRWKGFPFPQISNAMHWQGDSALSAPLSLQIQQHNTILWALENFQKTFKIFKILERLESVSWQLVGRRY